MTVLTLAIMYLVPLAAMTWLYSIKPGYALIAAVVLGALAGVGTLATFI